MVAYNFQKQFVEKIRLGQKYSTIRLPRKRNGHALVLDRLQLYTGMRTKQCQKIADTICVERQQVQFDGMHCRFSHRPTGSSLLPRDVDHLAQMEGFESVAEMLAWFSAPEYQGQWLEQIIWNPRDVVLTVGASDNGE